ncbi:LAME_0H04126g1_1 [Lachancea meyersii CBS 8951]|uniref:LAME_0H04126g1_1 n=1 Tax=Lachancea meyersii CBS 8951 TaxID=1266667 RepID=A0A1G4KDT7_9SACH|nr:LAME_0H04126g1_1 [Lachancea meyersii CBS 8951]
MSTGKQVLTAEVKLVLLGESSVGKSALVTRFTTGHFHRNNATIGAAFTTKTVSWENDSVKWQVKFEIWDTAGQERYRSLAPMYYRKTDVALVVFDVTEGLTHAKANSWIEELQNYMHDTDDAESIVIKVVGNKTDLLDSPPSSGIDWIPVSAKSGSGVMELFESVAKQIPTSRFVGSDPSIPKVVNLESSRSDATGCSC